MPLKLSEPVSECRRRAATTGGALEPPSRSSAFWKWSGGGFPWRGAVSTRSVLGVSLARGGVGRARRVTLPRSLSGFRVRRLALALARRRVGRLPLWCGGGETEENGIAPAIRVIAGDEKRAQPVRSGSRAIVLTDGCRCCSQNPVQVRLPRQ
jgi:hypothetical protein